MSYFFLKQKTHFALKAKSYLHRIFSCINTCFCRNKPRRLIFCQPRCIPPIDQCFHRRKPAPIVIATQLDSIATAEIRPSAKRHPLRLSPRDLQSRDTSERDQSERDSHARDQFQYGGCSRCAEYYDNWFTRNPATDSNAYLAEFNVYSTDDLSKETKHAGCV